MADLVHHDVLDRLAEELLGQLVLGLGLLGGCLVLVFRLCRPAGLAGAVGVGQGDGGQAEVVLEAGLELAEAAAPAREVLGELPGERVLVGGDDLGHHLGRGSCRVHRSRASARACGWP